MCNMIIECCSQERTYSKFYGLMGERFCKLNMSWSMAYEQCFRTYYDTIHRYETNRLRNIARFFGHLLSTDAIAWTVLDQVKMNEDDTTSSSRIFIKIMFQEVTEGMGLKKLVERFKDPSLKMYLGNILPVDNPRNTRFSINFFTSIGLGAVTEEMREHLKRAPAIIVSYLFLPSHLPGRLLTLHLSPRWLNERNSKPLPPTPTLPQNHLYPPPLPTHHPTPIQIQIVPALDQDQDLPLENETVAEGGHDPPPQTIHVVPEVHRRIEGEDLQLHHLRLLWLLRRIRDTLIGGLMVLLLLLLEGEVITEVGEEDTEMGVEGEEGDMAVMIGERETEMVTMHLVGEEILAGAIGAEEEEMMGTREGETKF